MVAPVVSRVFRTERRRLRGIAYAESKGLHRKFEQIGIGCELRRQLPQCGGDAISQQYIRAKYIGRRWFAKRPEPVEGRVLKGAAEANPVAPPLPGHILYYVVPPDVPTLRESGFDIVEASGTWFAIYAPAGTPATVAERLRAAILDALQNAEIRARIDSLGFEVAGTTGEELARIQRADYERWGPIIKASGFKVGR